MKREDGTSVYECKITKSEFGEDFCERCFRKLGRGWSIYSIYPKSASGKLGNIVLCADCAKYPEEALDIIVRSDYGRLAYYNRVVEKNPTQGDILNWVIYNLSDLIKKPQECLHGELRRVVDKIYALLFFKRQWGVVNKGEFEGKIVRLERGQIKFGDVWGETIVENVCGYRNLKRPCVGCYSFITSFNGKQKQHLICEGDVDVYEDSESLLNKLERLNIKVKAFNSVKQ